MYTGTGTEIIYNIRIFYLKMPVMNYFSTPFLNKSSPESISGRFRIEIGRVHYSSNSLQVIIEMAEERGNHQLVQHVWRRVGISSRHYLRTSKPTRQSDHSVFRHFEISALKAVLRHFFSES
jgi:hypothetical protein